MLFANELRPSPTEVSAFIDERREDFGVELICGTLGVSASAYCQRATGERSERAAETSGSLRASAKSERRAGLP